jgi:hypothetical protein
MDIPATTDRVPIHTSDEANDRIRRTIETNVRRYTGADPATIAGRLDELDREWDIERTLEANAATISLVGLALGTFVDRRFYLLSAAVAGFLLQHAVQGWCPPVPFFRRRGVRTQPEIEEERHALKALRGDFEPTADAAGADRAARALAAARV